MMATMGRLGEAEKLSDHAVQIDPTNAVIHFRLSTVYQILGRKEDAKQEAVQYKKYSDMKDKLRETYKELRLNPHKLDLEDNGENP